MAQVECGPWLIGNPAVCTRTWWHLLSQLAFWSGGPDYRDGNRSTRPVTVRSRPKADAAVTASNAARASE